VSCDNPLAIEDYCLMVLFMLLLAFFFLLFLQQKNAGPGFALVFGYHPFWKLWIELSMTA
jgi:hypothetical protein